MQLNSAVWSDEVKTPKEIKTSDISGAGQEGVRLGGDLQARGVRGDGWVGGRAPHAL